MEPVHGIISILLAAKHEIGKIYGFEIQSDIAEMANRSVLINNLQDVIEIRNENLVGLSEKGWTKKFDIVVTNPPYKKINTGLINSNERKLISRHEVKCKLEDVIYESSKILKDKGTFFIVHRPDRIVDILNLMRQYKLEPKEMRLVYPFCDSEANLVLIKGVKLGKAFLKVLKPLIVYEKNGNYSKEIFEIYGKV